MSLEDTYLVEVTDLADDHDTAVAAVEALGVPTGYTSDEVIASQRGTNPLWFDVVATYKYQFTSFPADGNPVNRPSILTVTWKEWAEAYFEDEATTPKQVANYAGELYAQLPQRQNGSMVLQITKNFSSINLVTYDALKFTRNSAGVLIRGVTYPAKSLLFLPPTCEERYEVVNQTEHHYYAVTFRLAVDENLHTDPIEDRGFRQLCGTPAQLVPILDDAGAPVEQPWPLNTDGTAKAKGVPPEVITYEPYAATSWSGLDFS